MIVRPEWIGQQGACHGISSLPDSSSSQKVLFTERSRRQLRQFHSCKSSQHNPDSIVNRDTRLQNSYLAYKLANPRFAAVEKAMEQEVEERNKKKGGNEGENKMDGKSDRPSEDFHQQNMRCLHCLTFLDDWQGAERAIRHILSEDPRSAYRRKRCVDKLYFFTVDSIHITAWFDTEESIVEIVKVKPNYVPI